MSHVSPIFRGTDAGGYNLPIDVDFQAEAARWGFRLGANQSSRLAMACAAEQSPVYEETHPVYSRSQWATLIEARDAEDGAGWLYRRIVRAHDQQNEGTCVYNMLALGMELTWCKQFGDLFWIPFSPVSGYRWNAPGPGSGSNVADSVLWSVKHGLIPEDTADNKALVAKGYFGCTHPAVGYYAKFASGWEKTSELFKVLPEEVGGWYRLATVDGWFSALFDGNVCCGARDWHALAHVGAACSGTSFASILCNSWGPWGATLPTSRGPIRSFGVDSMSKVSTMVKHGAFVLTHMRRPSFMDAWRTEALTA